MGDRSRSSGHFITPLNSFGSNLAISPSAGTQGDRPADPLYSRLSKLLSVRSGGASIFYSKTILDGEVKGCWLARPTSKMVESKLLMKWRPLSRYPTITYYSTLSLILDHSYLVTNSKIAETKTLEHLKSWHFCISNFHTRLFPNEVWVVQDYGHCSIIGDRKV